jgi:hypothetical protein
MSNHGEGMVGHLLVILCSSSMINDHSGGKKGLEEEELRMGSCCSSRWKEDGV